MGLDHLLSGMARVQNIIFKSQMLLSAAFLFLPFLFRWLAWNNYSVFSLVLDIFLQQFKWDVLDD